MNDEKKSISLRIIFADNVRLSVCSRLAASTTDNQLRDDVRALAVKWMDKFNIDPKRELVEQAFFEFVSQDTLDYINALESVLEGLEADPDTPDEILEQIEKVMR